MQCNVRYRLRCCLLLLGILVSSLVGEIFSHFNVCKFVEFFASVIPKDQIKLVE